jgi:hypothetical protein
LRSCRPTSDERGGDTIRSLRRRLTILDPKQNPCRLVMGPCWLDVCRRSRSRQIVARGVAFLIRPETGIEPCRTPSVATMTFGDGVPRRSVMSDSSRSGNCFWAHPGAEHVSRGRLSTYARAWSGTGGGHVVGSRQLCVSADRSVEQAATTCCHMIRPTCRTEPTSRILCTGDCQIVAGTMREADASRNSREIRRQTQVSSQIGKDGIDPAHGLLEKKDRTSIKALLSL